jgi:hypothetical protein
VFLRKLIKIFSVVAVLSAAGGALYAEGRVSANLIIVTKPEQQQLKQKDGFIALLKRAAHNWGRGVVQAVAAAGRIKHRHAATLPHKSIDDSKKISISKNKSPLMHIAASIRVFMLAPEPSFGGEQVDGKKDEITANLCKSVFRRPDITSDRAQVCPFDIFLTALSFKQPSLLPLRESFRAMAQDGMALNGLGLAVASGSAWSEGEIHQTSHSTIVEAALPSACAIFSDKFHFTIDLTKPWASLTHGAMGARYALCSDRSRNHRA